MFGLRPRFVGFVLFLLFASLFPLAKRKSGWGICGSSFLVWLWFLFLLIQSICRLQGPFVLAICISCLLSCKDRAFSATSATLEEKKKVPRHSSRHEGLARKHIHFSVDAPKLYISPGQRIMPLSASSQISLSRRPSMG